MRSKLGQVKKGQRLLKHAKKVLSSSPGLVIFVLNLPKGQVLFFLGGGNSNCRRIVMNPANQKGFLGLVEMTCGPVHASYSMPE